GVESSRMTWTAEPARFRVHRNRAPHVCAVPVERQPPVAPPGDKDRGAVGLDGSEIPLLRNLIHVQGGEGAAHLFVEDHLGDTAAFLVEALHRGAEAELTPEGLESGL